MNRDPTRPGVFEGDQAEVPDSVFERKIPCRKFQTMFNSRMHVQGGPKSEHHLFSLLWC